MTLLENKQQYNSEIPRQIENDLSLSGWETMCKNPEALAQVPQDTTLTIGFGVSHSLTPRILAYPLLALEMLKSNPQMQLEIYIATQFATLQGVTETQGELFAMQLQQAIQGSHAAKADAVQKRVLEPLALLWLLFLIVTFDVTAF